MISCRWILVLCSVAVACVSSYTPRSNNRADLQRYVERAAAVVRELIDEDVVVAAHPGLLRKGLA